MNERLAISEMYTEMENSLVLLEYFEDDFFRSLLSNSLQNTKLLLEYYCKEKGIEV